ncbi:3-hydroxyisobutyrate dehydrogenase [Bordetella avium]|uniref:3-hydroxyisobutyrate dehydrogenase n=1 Tax=Bordetella avium (strain 197N) TaxID=360910 RepID=Q2L112_BORA1|nr:3-hydroxyisobutyrate dehydrogenase [Bordetella avium]AZY49134.1 3-hydroxyisobutyrate dehydrogenase [Bordetella avium]AZY52492.1 3-hydroxyisobutyrate dehydrogenase [Bordetella avium]RIQ12285.1 3-hydroxyisobutyrate dehydrogenase [Bordetella avium]RIQ19343.1 3-hydroxyisobutyrate dehydrogenase [Bordetella avium]RIQ33512.1 3-hydroxyisobutyrate dehydrogenase [Bordetella avium]
MSSIAFIGLGNMGAPMALNLVKAGHSLVVFDLLADAVQRLTEAGARAATSASAAVDGADIVITMLPASKHVEHLYLEQDLLGKIKAGALVIDCSTIAPDSARKVAAAATARGLEMIDAPVSGGTGGAVAGTLTFIVGGAALERARPVLEKMGKNIFHAGEAGSGQVAKICNNMLLGILMAGTSEALALGVANGLDPKVLSDIIAKSSGRNWATELYNPWPGVMPHAPASHGYAGGFGVDLMLKDLGLAAEAALGSRSSIPLGELARNLYSLHSNGGSGRLDFSSIVNLYANDND